MELGEGHTTGPLNYFIYPHVEVAGRRIDGVKSSFRYAEVPEAEVPGADCDLVLLQGVEPSLRWMT